MFFRRRHFDLGLGSVGERTEAEDGRWGGMVRIIISVLPKQISESTFKLEDAFIPCTRIQQHRSEDQRTKGRVTIIKRVGSEDKIREG